MSWIRVPPYSTFSSWCPRQMPSTGRPASIEPPRHGQVQGVLGGVHVVAGRALVLAVKPGVQVAAARKDDAVERLELGAFSGAAAVSSTGSPPPSRTRSTM